MLNHWLALAMALCTLFAPAIAQEEEASPKLDNTGFEEGTLGETPSDWGFFSQTGSTASTVAEGAYSGSQCALVDASEAKGDGQLFANLMQSLDAKPWRGKRLRYRAMVKTADLTAGSKVQLWFRIDREPNEDGSRRVPGFDNMADRPISVAAWEPFEIVLDVAEDADKMILGMFVIGNGRAWVDDVTLEVVGDDVQATRAAATPTESAASNVPTPQISQRVREALGAADQAPQQPFWTAWLFLPMLAVLLFAIGLWPTRRRELAEAEPLLESEEDRAPAPRPGLFRSFALRFTMAYWLLYCLPGPVNSFASGIGQGVAAVTAESSESAKPFFEASAWLGQRHGEFESWMAHKVGETFFGIEGELVPPNGSGDTTQGYLAILGYFGLALVLASLWTLIRRHFPRRDVSVDLLRSYLRYVLALAMLGYGIAKTSIEFNQFPVVAEWRLSRTWGETSPMGVVWAFMGSSRPYTVFAGLGEILGAVLLIWRRTTILGAFVAIGVMTNVVMLNYCYDVPVKIYSTHLWLMGLLILAPDVRRLGSLLLLGKNPADTGTPNAWAGKGLRWVRLPLKGLILVTCFGLPLFNNAKELWTHFSNVEEQQPDVEAEAAKERPLLVRRGYRWINEVPFNR